jgi:CheY-like chemotaxis protein
MAEDKRRRLILVVDDDASIRRMVATALKARGYDVEEAGDGLVASEMLGRMANHPDLMICDVMMPTIDGFSLARLVKNHKELRSMPIIFLTAKSQPADLKTGIALGARHYVQKPFSVVDLVDKVDKTLR